MTVAVIGDAALDVSVAASEPPVPNGDTPASIRLGPGGQAANVAVRLARRGVPVRLVAPIAEDPAGSLLAAMLRAEGVELCALPAPHTSLVLALLDVDGERTMLSDRAVIDPAAAARATDSASWIHASGYALADDRSGDALASALGDRDAGVRVSVAGGSFRADAAAATRILGRLRTARLDLLVLSESEVASLLGETPAGLPAARALGACAAIAVVTSGARGSALVCGDVELVEPAAHVPGAAVDSTGTGDAFAATLIAELRSLAWPVEERQLRAAMAAASRSGAQVARVRGAQARVADEPERAS